MAPRNNALHIAVFLTIQKLKENKNACFFYINKHSQFYNFTGRNGIWMIFSGFNFVESQENHPNSTIAVLTFFI